MCGERIDVNIWFVLLAHRAGQQGWSFVDLLADFHLLLFISEFFGPEEMPIICASIMNRDEPLSEGYQLLLRSIAGMDG